MDDIRRPNHQRRDFAMRHRPHQPPAVPPNQAPAQPQHQPQPTYHSPQAYEAPAPPVQADDYGFAPAAASETGYEHYSQPLAQPRPAAAPKKKPLPKIRLKYAGAGLAVLILIIAAVYVITKPPQKSGFTVAQLAKKSTFGFYYPQPLPDGYTYVTKINAFQNDQAYFMVANGSKHIIFHEASSADKLNTSPLTDVQSIQTSVGKASIGMQDGQPAATVMAGSTLIAVNTTGAVPTSDLTTVIGRLKTDR